MASGFYARNEGRDWIKCMILTATLFPGMCLFISFSLNTIAIFYHSLAAVPFGTMVEVRPPAVPRRCRCVMEGRPPPPYQRAVAWRVLCLRRSLTSHVSHL